MDVNMDPSELMQQLSMMMSCMQTSASSIEKFTNKTFLIKCQNEALKRPPGMQNGNAKSETGTVDENETGKFNKTDLDPKNMVDISFLSKNVNSKLEGKFLLCRNITPPCKISSLVSVVDDPQGEKAVRLAIYNLKTVPSNLLEILPLGKILAVKNPWMKQTMDGGYFVRVDDIHDVILLSQETFHNNFPSLKWKSEIPKEYQYLIPPEKEKSATKTWEDWKNEGNAFFVQKKYEEAVSSYTEALKVRTKNVDVLANRSAAYINLGYFVRALEDSELAVKIEPNHLKGIFRKARCLGELRRYDDAVTFLHGKISNHSEFKKSKDLTTLLDKLRRMQRESQTGTYDIIQLFGNPLEFCKEIADFTGPVQIEKIEGKGRGLVASEDICAGQVLLISKAFAIMYPDAQSSFSSQDKLVHKIAEKLKVEPELGKELYQLYAGTDLDSEEIDFGNVDLKRIDGICTYNCFGGNIEKVVGKAQESVNLKGKDQKSCGLWIRPGYINHSCWNCNSFWMTFGDIMIVRAFKDISRGEEILMPYINPTEPYEKRKLVFQKHNFLCDCIICDLDRSESEEVHEERKNILEEIENCSKNVDDLVKLVNRLEKVRDVEPNLNVSMVFPLRVLGLICFKNGQFKQAAKELIKAHDIIENSPLIHFAANYAQNIVTAFIYENDEKEILRWVKILKRDYLIAYGSLQIIKLIGKETYSKLQTIGITFEEIK